MTASSSTIACSTRSSRRSIDRASRAWLASKVPVSAWARSGILRRIRPFAISASRNGSVSPLIIAVSIALADTVFRLDATEESLMLASWVDDHRVAEVFELGYQPSGVRFVVAAGVPVGAQVVVGLVAFQHPVGRHQDGVRDRNLGSPHPTPAHQPGMLGSQVVLAVHPADRSGGLDQHRGQPFVAVPLPAGLCLPADSFIAGAKPAQAAKWAAVGNRDMSPPVSAMITSATFGPTPGIVCSSSI